MELEFEVTGEAASSPGPPATLDVSIPSASGTPLNGGPGAGRHTVAVHFPGLRVHENIVQHDPHLVQHDDDINLQSPEIGTDWRLRQGLDTPSPEGLPGSANEMPAGTTAYLNGLLAPGRHGREAEVPGSAQQAMFRIFSVTGPESQARGTGLPWPGGPWQAVPGGRLSLFPHNPDFPIIFNSSGIALLLAKIGVYNRPSLKVSLIFMQTVSMSRL